jgi:hypothetical protein
MPGCSATQRKVSRSFFVVAVTLGWYFSSSTPITVVPLQIYYIRLRPAAAVYRAKTRLNEYPSWQSRILKAGQKGGTEEDLQTTLRIDPLVLVMIAYRPFPCDV